MRENQDTTQFIKETAKELGFDDCGIDSPVVLEMDIEYLNTWISGKKHGYIKYLEKNIPVKKNPRKLMENAKAVIALVKNYYPDKKQHDGSFYKIAKYAYGDDYHELMKSKAYKLIRKLQKKLKGGEFRIFVDSNTVLEKAWAARCGLGWIGKNTLLINPEIGSYMFICIILTDLLLEYDEMMEDGCGNCNACIEACPVKALEKPYQLNASICIAALTIENIPQDALFEKGHTKGWIYGCDICQDVCPWNKDIKPLKERAFLPNPELMRMTRKDWEKLDGITFKKLFEKSAVKRIGLGRLMKNIENA